MRLNITPRKVKIGIEAERGVEQKQVGMLGGDPPRSRPPICPNWEEDTSI